MRCNSPLIVLQFTSNCVGIIEEETFRAGGGLNLDQEVENETLLTYYPLHELEVLEELRAT